jgi:hypothetical protein
MFLRNVGDFQRTTWRYIPEDTTSRGDYKSYSAKTAVYVKSRANLFVTDFSIIPNPSYR